MGCSSSALPKAGDSGRLRGGVPSNECISTVEESESCVAQPKPCTPGRESTFYSKVQRESLPPLERPKASVAPTANGVKPRHEVSLVKDSVPGKDATDKSEPTEKTGTVESPQPGDKDDTPGTEEKKRDVETMTEVQPFKGNAETERLGTEAKGQPLRTAGERDSPAAGEGTQNLQTAPMIKPLAAAENSLPLESARELQPGKATGRDEYSQMSEAIPNENKSPEILEGCHFVEKVEQKLQETSGKDESQLLEAIPTEKTSPEILEGSQFVEKVEQQKLQDTSGKDDQSQLLEAIPTEKTSPEILEESQLAETSEEQLQETLGKDKQPQLQDTILKENATLEISDRNQCVQTPRMNSSLHELPEGPGHIKQIQPEEIAGSREHSAGTADTGTNVEMARNSHKDEEEQQIEGETGEKVEAEAENNKVSEGAETKEEETGEAVDLSAAGDGDRRANGHSVLQ